MPILDPGLQFAFSDTRSIDHTNYGKRFFLYYLKIASRNIFQNIQTIEAAEQFKTDVQNSISYLNNEFGCHLAEEDFEGNQLIFNYYKYLFDNISDEIKEKYMKKVKGEYRIFSNNMKFFVPYVDFSESHCWHLTDSPIAILGVNPSNIGKKNTINLINLEIDLMQAAGFTLVLCVRIPNYEANLADKIICGIIQTHFFSEIHFAFDFEEDNDMDGFEEVAELILDAYDDIKGYFYLYSPFFDLISPTAKKYIKELKKKPRFTNTSLSKEFHFSLDNVIPDIIGSKSFPYCKTGFNYDKIRIMLCNVPYYDSDDDKNDLIPSGISNLCVAYISPDDFMTWKQNRIPSLIDLRSKGLRHVEKYLDFDDIHDIKSDFYVTETIFMANSDYETLEAVENILREIDSEFESKKDDQFKKQNIFSKFKKKDIQKGLIYVAYAYNHYVHNADPTKEFNFHLNQMFTAFDACRICVSKDENSGSKGIIYQVETGEGKSCIIHVVAAVLALMNKTVHIASSNVKLLNRDYYDSYSFFKKLGLTSAALLHYNELPYVNNDGTIKKDTKYEQRYYPDEFFNKELFNNSSKMNYSVCGINNSNQIKDIGANIVFSTFINFESLYLKIMELYPSFIPKFFSKCNLLIDEADTILIDELTNGTILSCPMKSNGSEVLEYVYKNQEKDVDIIVKDIKENWPECNDINNEDIMAMIQEIELIKGNEFQDGKKYLIDTIKVKKNIITKSKEKIEKVKVKAKNISKNAINKIAKKEVLHLEEIKDEKPLKQIIPFDYDHKGILEPNKEFSGFVQQFIAIKEKISNEENENMIIKDLSMNYLYVSHPIFVNLYNGVCGFTGTLGNKYDKEILKKQYNLETKKIPRNLPNKRVDFPVIICNDIVERNARIVEEIVSFHKKQIPILAIFQDLNEIADVLKMLILQGIKNINIFDGKDEKIKPDRISGVKGAISLGTNVCGRGTDIKKPALPLHVIVSYFSSNTRVMLQAFGRTARQGAEGTSRVICTKEQYISPIEIFNNDELNKSLLDFDLKNKMQLEFIEKYRTKRKWIFSSKMTHQNISSDIIQRMRNVRINVNRLKAYHFKFPICMSYATFLNIQAQKIFSLYNCPNCKYTWMLFQKYLREMILESWSLFITQAERRFNVQNNNIKSFNEYLQTKISDLYKELDKYLPDSKFDIIPTFMHIFHMVAANNEADILKAIPKKFSFYYEKPQFKRFCTFTIGFKPYSLIGNSGSKINSLSNQDEELEYIKDPELQYMKQQPKGLLSPISITEKIDGVFNLICKKINEVIGTYIGIKFFLRRTLGGCEFGVCLDFVVERENSDIDPNCLIDTNPLLVFTISVRSMIPILAGILIIGLVYIASVSANIADWVAEFPVKLTRELVVKTVKVVAEYLITNALEKKIEKFCESICVFLMNILSKQIDKINKYNPKIADIFNLLSTLAASKDITMADKIGEMFEKATHINLNINIGNVFQPNLPVNQFIKIGLLIMLCFASFMMGFNLHHNSLKYKTSKVASSYDKKQDPERAYEKKKHLVSIEKMNPYKE